MTGTSTSKTNRGRAFNRMYEEIRAEANKWQFYFQIGKKNISCFDVGYTVKILYHVNNHSINRYFCTITAIISNFSRHDTSIIIIIKHSHWTYRYIMRSTHSVECT